MDDRLNPDADGVAQARALLTAAAERVKQLESTASHAFCRFVALTGMLSRLETLAGSCEPDAADAAALDAATVCRETKVLLLYIDSHGTWAPQRFTARWSDPRPKAAAAAGRTETRER